MYIQPELLWSMSPSPRGLWSSLLVIGPPGGDSLRDAVSYNQIPQGLQGLGHI